MKPTITEVVDLPKGIQASLGVRSFSIRGPKGEVSRHINPAVALQIDDSKLTFTVTRASRKDKACMYSAIAHTHTMVKGVQEPYVYRLKICSGHFPMACTTNSTQFVIKNFLGEKVPRVVKLRPGVTVKIESDKVVVTSVDKELAGQTAADIELSARARNKDLRRFQDGIYIIEKAGVPI